MKTISLIAQADPVPARPVDFPLIGTGALVLAISGFIFKWLFDQTVKSWEKRMDKLEVSVSGIERNDQQQAPLISQLGKTIDQLSGQVQSLTESNRQIALLTERQNVFDQRLQNFGGALQDTQRLYTEAQKEYLALKADLSANYLRREDWLRFSNILETKLDENNRRVDDIKELFKVLRHE